MAYKKPTLYKQVNDEIFTNFGQEVELQVREIDGEPNPRFTKYRNAYPRVFVKNGKVVRILSEIDGIIDLDNPLAVVPINCKATEHQPVLVRVRIEKPVAKMPKPPTVFESEPL